MNTNTNSNIKLSNIYGFSILRKIKNKGIFYISTENIINKYREIELESKTTISTNDKSNKNLQLIIKLGDTIINSNSSKLNLIFSNKNNLELNKSNNLNNELTKSILNDSNSILMNKQQYIELISPFNSKLAILTNLIYTFTNRPYKQININLYNLYILCKSAFLNMSSIISKPIVSINPNLIKITLFFYWKPLSKNYYNSNLHSKFLILHNDKLEKLINFISKIFKRSVELELIRIYSPQNESNILANLIGILSNFIKFKHIYMKLFKISNTQNINEGFNSRFIYNKIPSVLSGISLKLAGKVLTQKLQKRVKSYIIQKGSFSKTSTRLININRFVNKNKRGTFSITIKTGQIIND